ncbi:hypothetical protein ZEAMMB73_Zm00001d020661 [Zea mays]|uniref:Uncharacterized protein n=1 Tax=Zea mays TaxID=4577 RepID=A0A1D6I5F1_MAIZE|nr:hypothetical protein ZEAMMB73_Zm00001d020661 [Zea mays]
MISCGGGDFDDFLDAFFHGLRSFVTNNLLLLVLLNFEEIFRFEARFSEVWKLLLILTNLSKEVWFNSALFVQARATGCLILIQFAGESILWPYYLFSRDDGSSRMVSKGPDS